MAYGATGWSGVLGSTAADALQKCLGDKINFCGQMYADNPLMLDPCIETAKQTCAAPKPSSGGGGGGGTTVNPAAPDAAFTPGMSSNASAFVKGGLIAAVAVAGLLVAKKKGWLK